MITNKKNYKKQNIYKKLNKYIYILKNECYRLKNKWVQKYWGIFNEKILKKKEC